MWEAQVTGEQPVLGPQGGGAVEGVGFPSLCVIFAALGVQGVRIRRKTIFPSFLSTKVYWAPNMPYIVPGPRETVIHKTDMVPAFMKLT